MIALRMIPSPGLVTLRVSLVVLRSQVIICLLSGACWHMTALAGGRKQHKASCSLLQPSARTVRTVSGKGAINSPQGATHYCPSIPEMCFLRIPWFTILRRFVALQTRRQRTGRVSKPQFLELFRIEGIKPGDFSK